MTTEPTATTRPARLGIGGPVGSGKTMCVLRLCQWLREEISMAVVTNDIYTREDAEFLTRNEALPADRILGVETGGCPHTAIRDDTSMNAAAIEELERRHPDLRLILVESGGRSEEHTSELQSQSNLVCRLLLEKKKRY